MTRAQRLLVVAGALGVGLSCFSDRHAGIAEPDDSGGPDCTVPGSAIGSDRTVVLVRNFRFLTDTLRIRAGTTVAWVNCEAANIEAHTVTSTTGIWDSGSVLPGSSYTRKFDNRGTFSYFCQPHPTMVGTIIVD